MTSTQVERHELIQIAIDDVKLDKANPNQMTQQQMHALRQSMQRWGYLTPIIIDQNNMIADGEHRYLVYKELGYQEIPAYRLELANENERLLIRQTMNKLHGEHDRQLDSNELTTILQRNSSDLATLADLIAQRKEDLQYLITKYNPQVWIDKPEDWSNAKPIDEIVPQTKLGDLYQLDNHRLICADCTDKRMLERLMDGKEVHQLNTDPPYGVRYGDKNAVLNAIHGGNRNETQYESDDLDYDYRQMFNTLFEIIPFADPNTIYVWSGGKHLYEILGAFNDSGIYHGSTLVWVKNNHSLALMGADYNPKHEFAVYGWKKRHRFYANFRTSVLEYDKPTASQLHPAMKPLELIKQTIEDGSQQGDNILDLFTGSGTTLMAAEQSNRNFFGVEIDPHYCDVIVNRWQEYTGRKAVLL